MMDNEFDRVFDQCIDLLNEGQSIDDILRLYPAHAEALKPLLEAVIGLSGQVTSIPAETAKAAGRQRLHHARYELHRQQTVAKPSLFERFFAQPRLWAPAAVVLLVFLVGLATLILVDSEDSDNSAEIIASSSTPSVSPSATPDDIVVADAGILEIRVTDAPNHEISAVYMTISNIEVNQSYPQSGTDDDNLQEPADNGGWQTVISESNSFELLELRGGIEKVLGSKQFEAGHYQQIRLNVEEVIVTVDGQDRKAKLPSGKIKLVSSFQVKEGMTTALTLDFDAEQSIVITGQGEAIFKPVIRLIIR